MVKFTIQLIHPLSAYYADGQSLVEYEMTDLPFKKGAVLTDSKGNTLIVGADCLWLSRKGLPVPHDLFIVE
jgi:hypothetical protein